MKEKEVKKMGKTKPDILTYIKPEPVDCATNELPMAVLTVIGKILKKDNYYERKKSK